jgi:hypothetical protein
MPRVERGWSASSCSFHSVRSQRRDPRVRTAWGGDRFCRNYTSGAETRGPMTRGKNRAAGPPTGAAPAVAYRLLSAVQAAGLDSPRRRGES